MTDAFSDNREQYEKHNEMCVFIVLIETFDAVGVSHTVGACYWNELAAKEEAKRLRDSSSHTHAYYVQRWLPYPTFVEVE